MKQKFFVSWRASGPSYSHHNASCTKRNHSVCHQCQLERKRLFAKTQETQTCVSRKNASRTRIWNSRRPAVSPTHALGGNKVDIWPIVDRQWPGFFITHHPNRNRSNESKPSRDYIAEHRKAADVDRLRKAIAFVLNLTFFTIELCFRPGAMLINATNASKSSSLCNGFNAQNSQATSFLYLVHRCESKASSNSSRDVSFCFDAERFKTNIRRLLHEAATYLLENTGIYRFPAAAAAAARLS